MTLSFDQFFRLDGARMILLVPDSRVDGQLARARRSRRVLGADHALQVEAAAAAEAWSGLVLRPDFADLSYGDVARALRQAAYAGLESEAQVRRQIAGERVSFAPLPDQDPQPERTLLAWGDDSRTVPLGPNPRTCPICDYLVSAGQIWIDMGTALVHSGCLVLAGPAYAPPLGWRDPPRPRDPWGWGMNEVPPRCPGWLSVGARYAEGDVDRESRLASATWEALLTRPGGLQTTWATAVAAEREREDDLTLRPRQRRWPSDPTADQALADMTGPDRLGALDRHNQWLRVLAYRGCLGAGHRDRCHLCRSSSRFHDGRGNWTQHSNPLIDSANLAKAPSLLPCIDGKGSHCEPTDDDPATVGSPALRIGAFAGSGAGRE